MYLLLGLDVSYSMLEADAPNLFSSKVSTMMRSIFLNTFLSFKGGGHCDGNSEKKHAFLFSLKYHFAST